MASAAHPAGWAAAATSSAPNLLSLHRRHFRFSSTTPLRKALLFAAGNGISTSPIRTRLSRQLCVSSSGKDSIFVSGEGVNGGNLPLDSFLSAAEFLCLVPPVLYSAACFVGLFVPRVAKLVRLPAAASKLFASQYFLLLGAVVVGTLVRRRQWRRLCFVDYRGTSVDLVSRVERVEDDLKSSSRISSLLSRQLEKLAIRFRITKKAFKDPISEMAALAQKNSEATRALAVQKDLLEKELREMQNVLLAMQEQQQKQLQLILAIANSQRKADVKRNLPEESKSSGETSAANNIKVKQLKVQSEDVWREGNDKA